MKLMALKLDDRYVMVIYFFIILEIIFWIAVTQNQVIDRAFPRKFL